MSMDRKDVTIELPYPPSINHYWRQARGRTHISDEGKRFRTDVQAILLQYRVPKLLGRLSVEVIIHPPDRRARDIDNVCKALLDSLQKGGLYENDCQIDQLRIERGEQIEHGRTVVRVSEI